MKAERKQSGRIQSWKGTLFGSRNQDLPDHKEEKRKGETEKTERVGDISRGRGRERTGQRRVNGRKEGIRRKEKKVGAR